MNGTHLSDDDRGSISPLSHALTIAITTILVIGLTVGASGLLQNERQSATREDLRTIGNRLAGELAHVDNLAQRGGTATIQSTHTERVAGSSYAVELLHGPPCDRNRIDVATCLRLSVEGSDVTEYVPVRNESAVSLDARTSGRFVLSAQLSGSTTQRSDVVMQDLSTRVGIGEDVTRNGDVIGRTLGNQPPLANFEFEPTAPTAGQEVRFDASSTFDADGDVDSYEWDWDGDGVVDDVTTDPVINHTFSDAGNYYVDLQVTDEEGAISNITRFIDVSGLVYNDDLNTGSNTNDVQFTVTNNFDDSLTITHILVDPDDDSIDRVNAGGSTDEIEISAPGDSGDDDDAFTVYTDGRIRALDDDVELDASETATVEINGFRDGGPENMDGERLRFGLKYELDGTTNSTIFSDVVGGPQLSDYRLVEDSGEVHLQFESDQRLGTIGVTYGGDTTGGLDEDDFTETSIGSGYRYETKAGSEIGTTPGSYWARLDTAETHSGVDSPQTPLNDTIGTVNPTGDYVWTTADDWDDNTDSTGVVHANFGDHSAVSVELGYSNFDEGGDDLVGYWSLDNQSGGEAADESGNDNHGTIDGNPGLTPGVGGSNAYSFDGDDDSISIPYSSDLEVDDDDEVTVSAWVRKGSAQSGWIGIFQNSDYSYNLQFRGGNNPSFSVYSDANDDDGYVTVTNWNDVQDGEWVHLAAVYDGDDWWRDNVFVYRDGNYVASGEADDIDANSDDGDSDDLGIGGNHDNAVGERNMDGTIDEVRVYDRALSAGEIRDLAETPEEGSFTTDWQSGDEFQQQHVRLQYNVSVDSGEEVWVRAVGETTGTPNTRQATSNWILIDSGDPDTGTVDVSNMPGLGNHAGRFQLEVTLRSSTVSGSPTVHSLSLEETP